MLVIWMCGHLYHGRWSLTIGGGTWRLDCNAKSDVQTENSRACVTYPYEATSINSVYDYCPTYKITFSGIPQYKHLSSLPGLRRAGSIKSGRLVAASI